MHYANLGKILLRIVQVSPEKEFNMHNKTQIFNLLNHAAIVINNKNVMQTLKPCIKLWLYLRVILNNYKFCQSLQLHW